jgi:hypothetical protein
VSGSWFGCEQEGVIWAHRRVHGIDTLLPIGMDTLALEGEVKIDLDLEFVEPLPGESRRREIRERRRSQPQRGRRSGMHAVSRC